MRTLVEPDAAFLAHLVEACAHRPAQGRPTAVRIASAIYAAVDAIPQRPWPHAVLTRRA